MRLHSACYLEAINLKTNTNWTALHSALARDHISIANFLLLNGASLDIPNPQFDVRHRYYSLLSNHSPHNFNTIDTIDDNNNNNNINNNMKNRNKDNIVNKQISISGVSIQIASDLHIEFFRDHSIDYLELIKPAAPILALLGDIGIPFADSAYSDFLLQMAQHFELVLVVAGNHEYYNKRGEKRTCEEIKAKIREICDKSERLIFMDKTSLTVNGVRIIGTTLWSFIPPFAYQVSERSLNDYNLIYVDNHSDHHHHNNHIDRENGEVKKMRLTADISAKWFEEELKWIQTEVELSMLRGDKSLVVLTHHTPSFFATSAATYDTHPFHHHINLEPNDQKWTNCCFSSDLEHLFANYGKVGNSNIKLWAYGHTHHNNDQVIYGTRIVSNQRGYVQNDSYSPNFVCYVGNS